MGAEARKRKSESWIMDGRMIRGAVEGGGGERMNVSRRDEIRWPPCLTAAPLRTTRGLELWPVWSCACVCMCVSLCLPCRLIDPVYLSHQNVSLSKLNLCIDHDKTHLLSDFLSSSQHVCTHAYTHRGDSPCGWCTERPRLQVKGKDLHHWHCSLGHCRKSRRSCWKRCKFLRENKLNNNNSNENSHRLGAGMP